MRVTIPVIGSLGVNRDEMSHELAVSALSDALNVRMRDGGVERMYGEEAVFTTPGFVPYDVKIFNGQGTRFVAYAGLAAVAVDDGGAVTDITGTAPTGAENDRWTGGSLNGVLVLNNGVDVPTFWNGDTGTNLATLTGWTATHRAYSLRPFRNYLVALNITKNTSRYPHMVKWSHAADPGAIPSSWNEVDPAVDAGEVDLAETSDTIIDGFPLGDSFIIYKQASMYSMQYIGGQNIFQFRRLPGESGILARNCACLTPAGHLVLTAGDVIVHSGAGPQSILTGRMRRWLFENIDSNFSERSFCVSNPGKNEAWICFPATGSETCNKALVWNWRDDTFSIRDISNATAGTSGSFEYSAGADWESDADAWDTDVTVWNDSDLSLADSRVLLATSAPTLIAADEGVTWAGVDFTASIERTGLTFDAPERVKLVKSLWPRIDGDTGETVYIQVGAAMDPEGAYAWSDPIPYVIGTTYRADAFASGRFLAYRIYSVTSFNWRVRSIDVDVEMMGEF